MAAESREFLHSVQDGLCGSPPEIPGMPEVTLRIVRRLADPGVRIDQIARLAGSEPSLAAAVLRAANSVAYNPSSEVTDDLRVATGRIGLAALRRLALAQALQVVRDAPRYRVVEDRLAAVWQRSVLLASLARVLSERVRGIARETATTAGMLQAVGRIWIIARAVDHPVALQDPIALEATLNAWHAEAAHRLLEAWGFGAGFAHAVAAHESADWLEGEVPRLADLLFVCQLFNAYRDTPQELSARLAVSPAATRLGLGGKERELVFGQSVAEIRAVREALCD
jgi:HD-like signal output (HDOD) protein